MVAPPELSSGVPSNVVVATTLKPYSRGQLKRIASELAVTYERAQAQLIATLKEGNLTDWGHAFTVQQLAQVDKILAEAGQTTVAWGEHYVPTLYQHGMHVADGRLFPEGLSKMARPGELSAMDLGMVKLHEDAVAILVESHRLRLFESLSYVGQRYRDMVARAQVISKMTENHILGTMAAQLTIRDVTLQTITDAFLQGKTRQQASTAFIQNLEAEGITSFIDKAGKKWNMDTYAEMVARTTSQEAQRHGTQNRIMEHGYDIVEISWHTGACPLCTPWQGKLVSLTGTTPDMPTMTDAMETGLWHPNCGHAVLPHITTAPTQRAFPPE